MSALFKMWNSIEQVLFPALEEAMGELSEKHKELIRVTELAEPGRFISTYGSKARGRKRKERLCIAMAFLAKAIWNLPTTGALLDRLRVDRILCRLCGWNHTGQIPSEATFSRAFGEFSQGELPQTIHEAMIKAQQGNKLVGHVSRDATAIQGREKAAPKQAPTVVRAIATPKKGRGPRRTKPMRRLELQPGRTLEENLTDLPKMCNKGCKRDSKGNPTYWAGYKLHVDWSDAGVPLSAILSSASMDDSQAAIPLCQMTEQRVQACYEVMDAAYDIKEIRAFIQSRGRVALIARNPQNGKVRMDPAQKVRFRERSSAERGNSDLKENYGARFVYVRGAAKVMAHLCFGLIALAASRLFAMVPT